MEGEKNVERFGSVAADLENLENSKEAGGSTLYPELQHELYNK